MTKTIIADGTTASLAVTSNYGDYHVLAGTTIGGGSSYIAYIYDDVYATRFTINGSVIGHGLFDLGNDSKVFVGASGLMTTDNNAIYMGGDGGRVDNRGAIDATIGVNFNGDGLTLVNSGTIHGLSVGVTCAGTATLINKQGGEISGDQFGVIMGYGGQTSTLRNDGTITGDFEAVHGSGDADRIVNTGRINGKISLADGNDFFRNSGGQVTGTIDGGEGDDRYYIDSSKVHLTELSGNGWDKVYSSATFRVNGEFEEVFLTGTANAWLLGNDAGTFLTGNVGNNRIIGGLGGDKITGGRGNDLMTGDDGKVAAGDGGADIFFFKAHSGRDTITDFHDGEDVIDLADYAGIDNFADIKGHIQQAGDDVVISLLDGDQITLRDTQRGIIGLHDFVFV